MKPKDVEALQAAIKFEEDGRDILPSSQREDHGEVWKIYLS